LLYCFTAWHRDGLGHAYNQACAIVPDDADWIALHDADVMLLPGTWGAHLESVLASHPEYDALVCMATRTWERGDQQMRRPIGIRDERDLERLNGAVVELAQKRYGAVRDWTSKHQPSGFFMCLRKRLWREHPFPLLGVQGKPRIGIETAWFRTLRAAGNSPGWPRFTSTGWTGKTTVTSDI